MFIGDNYNDKDIEGDGYIFGKFCDETTKTKLRYLDDESFVKLEASFIFLNMNASEDWEYEQFSEG